MKPSRRTQPYRAKQARPAGPTLRSILLGKPAYGPNPQDSKRRLRKMRGEAVRQARQNRARGVK